MNKLTDRIHDDNNELDYQLAGDYYIPVLTISEEKRRIGRWGECIGTTCRRHTLFC